MFMLAEGHDDTPVEEAPPLPRFLTWLEEAPATTATTKTGKPLGDTVSDLHVARPARPASPAIPPAGKKGTLNKKAQARERGAASRYAGAPTGVRCRTSGQAGFVFAAISAIWAK